MSKRREGREAAVQYLYQLDIHGDPAADLRKEFWALREGTDKVRAFAEALVNGVLQHQAELDDRIRKYREIIEIGDTSQFALQLAENPDDVPAVVKMLREEQLTNRSSLERLADFLLRLRPPGEPRAEIELPLDNVLVAARLGMQPETLSRSLARLRDAGVDTRGSRIVVDDVARLGRLAQGRHAP